MHGGKNKPKGGIMETDFAGTARKGKHPKGQRGLSIRKMRDLFAQRLNCMRCNQLMRGMDLMVHHIDGNYRNNYLNNLTVICRRCHREVHAVGSSNGTGAVHRHRLMAQARRKGTPCKWGSPEWAEKVAARREKRLEKVGGIEGFKYLWLDPSNTLQAIGDLLGVCRERVRQYGIALGLPSKELVKDYAKRQEGFNWPNA
jgi:hypothetical protein